MRIGIDGRLWNETGVGRYIRNLVTELVKIDSSNDYVLFARESEILSIRNLTTKDWKIVPVNIRWHTLAEQRHFPKIIEQENVDMMHFPYFSVPISYKNPYVVTIHDLILHQFPTGKASTLPLPLYKLKHLGYKYVIQQAAKNAVKIITVSNATKEEIVKRLNVSSSKIIVTYEGVDENLESRVQDPEFKNNAQKSKKIGPYFLYVGNLYPHKNIERLLTALRIVLTSEAKQSISREIVMGSLNPRNDIKLVIVGKKDFFFNQTVKLVQKLDLQNNVVFLGNVSDEELANLYHNAVATVVPSLMEGFGLPGLEAMSNNCLVISSSIPVLKEIYKDAAEYFDPKNVDNMAKIMEQVLNSPMQFVNSKKKGRERIKEFSWHKLAQETLKVYNTIVK